MNAIVIVIQEDRVMEPSTHQSSDPGRGNTRRRRGFFRWLTAATGALASAFCANPGRRLPPEDEETAGRLGRPGRGRRLSR